MSEHEDLGGNNQLNQQQRAERRAERHEPSTDSPRIYVVSLADFANARDHGDWIEADQDPQEIQAEIDAMLASSIVPRTTEWAIHDYEGFGGLDAADFNDLETLSAVALGIAEHGLAFAAYVRLVGTSQEALAGFIESYQGFWPSVVAYAEHLADEMSWAATLDRVVPESMRAYVEVNILRLATDIERGMHVAQADGGIYVFAST